MKNKHILSIKDLSIKDITEILTKAEKFLNKHNPDLYHHSFQL